MKLRPILTITDRAMNWYYSKTLWRRFGPRKCEMCNRWSVIQYEVGVGYWVCSDDACTDVATACCMADIKAARATDQKYKLYTPSPEEITTFDSGSKTVIEYDET